MGDGTSYYRKCYEEIFNDCYPCFRNNNIISEAGGSNHYYCPLVGMLYVIAPCNFFWTLVCHVMKFIKCTTMWPVLIIAIRCHILRHLIPHCCINVTLFFIMKTNLSKEMCSFESGRCMIVFWNKIVKPFTMYICFLYPCIHFVGKTKPGNRIRQKSYCRKREQR